MNVIHRLSTRRALLMGAGVLLFGLGAFATTSRCHEDGTQVDRWVLDADRDPRCYYGSSWNDGDLMMRRHALSATSFVHQFPFEDGCTWQSVETLVPDGPNHFRYQYDEQPISCSEGAVASQACPLSGSVVVIPEE
jgi:hypothetical protein